MIGYAIKSAKRRSGARWGTGKGNQAANARRGIRLHLTAHGTTALLIALIGPGQGALNHSRLTRCNTRTHYALTLWQNPNASGASAVS